MRKLDLETHNELPLLGRHFTAGISNFDTMQADEIAIRS